MKSSQDTVHESLKRGWGIAQTKWHHVELKESLRGANCCLLSVLRLHLYLPVTTKQVKGGEDTRPRERVQGLIDPGDGVGILPGHTVELAVVNTEAH